MFTGMSTGGARSPGDERVTGGADRARAALAGTRFADVRGVATTGSTNSDAMAAARDGAARGQVVLAGYRAPAPHDRAVVVVGIGVNVTWPQPALGRAGAHEGAESLDGGESLDGAAGIDGTDGIDEVAGIATALNWLAPPVDRADLLVAFLRRLDERYRALLAAGPAGLVAEWRRRSATLGRRVRVDLGADDVEGTAVDVPEEGHLVVENLGGGRRTLAVGDVVHLRPV